MKDITKKIQKEIDYASLNGGGIISVPEGKHFISSVELKSNITLHIPDCSELIGVPNLTAYKEIGYFHNELGEVKSLIYAMNAENVAIAGNGTININGSQYFDKKSIDIPLKMIDKISEEQKQECTYKIVERLNQPIFFKNIKNLRIQNVSIIDSCTWACTFVECQNIKVNNISMVHDMQVPNSDGLHFCSSTDIIVSGCNLKCGDDCVAFSGITDWNKPCERAIVSDCILESASKAVSIGFMHSIVRDIYISNCIVKNSNVAFSIMVSPKSGLIENIYVTNCMFEGRSYAGNWWGNGEAMCVMALKHDIENRGDFSYHNQKYSLKNLNISNCIFKTETPSAILSEENNIKDVAISNCKFIGNEHVNSLLKGNIIDIQPAKFEYNYSLEDNALLYIDGVDNFNMSPKENVCIVEK